MYIFICERSRSEFYTDANGTQNQSEMCGAWKTNSQLELRAERHSGRGMLTVGGARGSSGQSLHCNTLIGRRHCNYFHHLNCRFLFIKQPNSDDGGLQERGAGPTEFIKLKYRCQEIRNWQGKSGELHITKRLNILLSGHRTVPQTWRLPPQSQPASPTHFPS